MILYRGIIPFSCILQYTDKPVYRDTPIYHTLWQNYWKLNADINTVKFLIYRLSIYINASGQFLFNTIPDSSFYYG